MSKQEARWPMWILQQAFQQSVSKTASDTFNVLDEKLNVGFFIVGIPRDEKGAVCLEPPDECGYTPAFFSDIRTLAAKLEGDEAAKNAWKNPSGEIKKVPTSGRTVQKAIERKLNDPNNKNRYVSYSSEPVVIGDYDVCCILQFDEVAFRKYFAVKVEWFGEVRAPASLIDATAVEFVEVCRTALSGPRTRVDGFNPLVHRPEDILRMGGRKLMATAHASSLTTFDDINELSWKTHEGALAGGEIHFIHWDNYHLDMPITFKSRTELSNADAARKLIEMAGAKTAGADSLGDLHLVSHGHWIDGIGRLKELEDAYDEYNSHSFIVRFRGYYHWELLCNDYKLCDDDKIMMQVINGVPSLPQKAIDELKFREHVRRIFTQSSADEDALWNIVAAAVGQKHGTMILISSVAAAEADRLEEQSTVFTEPVALVEKVLRQSLLMLTSIDGALLVDPTGNCYAAGVILDGDAIKGKGTNSRGARYNSAIRYVYGARTNASKGQCLAVVISQDGVINLVPELRKQISRSEIMKHVGRVREAVAGETVDVKLYYRSIFWLSDHRFYLSSELCGELNELKNRTKLRLEQQRGRSDTPIDFKPDEEMDETYFLDESENGDDG